MAYHNLTFHRTHEEEQGVGFVLELINLANLNDKSKPSQTPCILIVIILTSVWSI